MSLREAASKILATRGADNSLSEFALKKFNERFPIDYPNRNNIWYRGYVVVSEEEITVFYGYAEDFEDHFKVILP